MPQVQGSNPRQHDVSVKENRICLNCLRPGHFVRQCKSQHKCRKCQRPHHTLLHVDTDVEGPPVNGVELLPSHTATGLATNSLLMTCQVKIHSPNGSITRARALLDSASSASFVSERLAQSLRLPLSTRSIRISGITGIAHGSPLQAVTTFAISPILSPAETLQLSAIVVP